MLQNIAKFWLKTAVRQEEWEEEAKRQARQTSDAHPHTRSETHSCRGE